MAWEMRGRSGPYYTRSRREGGRVVREYIGGGLRGELAAAVDQAARQQRAVVASALVAEQASLVRLDELMETLQTATDALARSALILGGFHRHARGEWRRRLGR